MMKKHLKWVILLAVVGAALGALSFASAQYSADSARAAIDAIGEVSYSEETRERIDAAQAILAEADPDLHVENQVANLEVLDAARREYARLAIKRLYVAIRDGEDEALIREYLGDAEEAVSRYLTDGEAEQLSNYADLLSARAKYSDDAPAQAAPVKAAPAAAVEVDLCGL